MTYIKMTNIKTIALLLCSISLTGCGISGGTIPQDHFYRLPAIEAVSQTNQQHIIIKPVRVNGLYHERAMLYVDQDQPLELKRYHYHYWVETPASLIHKSLSAYLATDKQANVKEINIELIPTLLNFERLLSPGKAEAYIKLHIQVNNLNHPEKSFSKTYEAKVASSSMIMHDTANAFGEALDEIAKALVGNIASA